MNYIYYTVAILLVVNAARIIYKRSRTRKIFYDIETCRSICNKFNIGSEISTFDPRTGKWLEGKITSVEYPARDSKGDDQC